MQKKTAVFVAKIGIQNQLFKYVKKKCDFRRKYEKSWCVCRSKKVRFAQPFGVKLKIKKKKKTIRSDAL